MKKIPRKKAVAVFALIVIVMPSIWAGIEYNKGSKRIVESNIVFQNDLHMAFEAITHYAESGEELQYRLFTAYMYAAYRAFPFTDYYQEDSSGFNYWQMSAAVQKIMEGFPTGHECSLLEKAMTALQDDWNNPHGYALLGFYASGAN